MPMRWLPFSRVSFQRVGATLGVLAGASESHVTSLDGISRIYEGLIRRQVVIPAERSDAVYQYLKEQRLWERHPALQGMGPDQLAGQRIDIQDLWLSDPSLPSASGAITEQVVDELPQLATGMRLLREHNYTLTDRGRALRAAAAAQVGGLETGTVEPNAFRLSVGGNLLFLFSLLEVDFDFLQAAYANAMPLLKSAGFTRMEFALGLDAACQELRKSWMRRARSGEDRQRVNKLDDLAKKIGEVKRKREEPGHGKWGGGRTPDQLATLRLEPLVDVGLLTRRSRFEYRYRLSPSQLGFFETMTIASSPEEFIDHQMCGALLGALGIARQRLEPEQIWELVKAAYAELRSSMGYASFREVVLLAMARAIDHEDGFFELADGVEVLHEQQRRTPRSVRFGVTRGGGITYVKISETRPKS